jgi:hypothetical protein
MEYPFSGRFVIDNSLFVIQKNELPGGIFFLRIRSGEGFVGARKE